MVERIVWCSRVWETKRQSLGPLPWPQDVTNNYVDWACCAVFGRSYSHKSKTEGNLMNSSEQNHGSESLSRRKFFKMGAASAVTLSVMNLARANAQGAAAPEATTHGTMVDVPFEKRNPRIAFIGVGGRGTSLLDNLLAAGAQIVSLCDVDPEH